MSPSLRRRHLLALVAYFLLTLVLTYPLLLHFTTHVVGDGSDDPALAWNLWWVIHSIFALGSSPIYTNYMFFPIGLNLGFYTLTYLNAFLSIPVQFAWGLIPATNLNLLLSFTLSGFGAYLLAFYLLRKTTFRYTTLAAFAAGLLYAFSANKFLYASLGQFNIASSQWIPFYLLFLIKLFDSPKPSYKFGILLGVFLTLQALSEFIFASFLVIFTIAYLAYWLIATRFAIENRKPVPSSGEVSKIANLFLAALLFLVVMSPILTAMISDTVTEGDFIQQGLGFSNVFSADLVGFFIPSHLHPLFGALESQFHFAYINFMYLGFVALALGILALIKVKSARIWGLWFLLILLLTLGPTLRINGAEFNLPLPFNLLLDIPLIKGNRYPSRWSVMLTLCLALLVAYGFAWFLDWLSRRDQSPRKILFIAACFLLPALLLFEHLSIPLPLSDFRVPDIYSQIQQDPGNWTVMEIPLAWRNGFRVTGSYRRDSQTLPDRSFMLAQWYQTTQQHPILNGNTSRNPELKFQYFDEAPVLNSLLAIQEGHTVDDARRARDKTLAPQVLQFFNTRYLIWHTPVEDENRDVANKTRAYIEDVFPVTKISESYENGRGLVVYRVNDLPVNDSVTITPTAPLARLYLGEGWGALGGDTLVAQRTENKIFLPLSEPRDMELTLENITPYPASGQGLTVIVNGHSLDHANPIPIANGNYSITLPASTLVSGMNEITLAFDKTVPYAPSGDDKFSIVVRSAGEEQGAFGHIYVNGKDESPNQRGYNVVVVEPLTGHVVDRANFDTFFDGPESVHLAEFLSNVAEGDLVAVAASDEASTHLTQDAVDALRSIGARTDLRGKFRWSDAIIGVAGAPLGSASEQSSETRVSQVYLNNTLTEPNIAATIGAIRIEPAH